MSEANPNGHGAGPARQRASGRNTEDAEAQKEDRKQRGEDKVEKATLIIAKPQLRNVNVERRFGEIPSITCSPSQVNQVFLNLIANAAQALDKPQKAIVVTTRREGADAIAVEVADNGKGIAPEVLPKIFDPFYTTKEVGKGTGLGLSIAYKIVSQHGGRIEVKSQPGKGTVFTVVLPVKPPEELAAAQA